MNKIKSFFAIFAVIAAVSVVSVTARANSAAKPAKSIEQQIYKKIVMLPYYGVFDHIAFQVNRACQPPPRRHDDASAFGLTTRFNRFANGFGVVGLVIGNRTVIGDLEITIREGRRFDAGKQGGHLLPASRRLT